MFGDLLLQLDILEQGNSIILLIGGAITLLGFAITGLSWVASRKANEVKKDLTTAIDTNRTEIGGKLDTLATSINSQATAQTKQGEAIVGVATELKNHLIKYSGEMAGLKTTVEAIKVDTGHADVLNRAGENRRLDHIVNRDQPHSRKRTWTQIRKPKTKTRTKR